MERTVFTDALVIDGTGRSFRGNMVVEGERILAVGKGGPRPDQAGVKVSLDGKALLPGMIDCHVHLRYDGDADPAGQAAADDVVTTGIRCYCNACRNLANGITTIRDCGCSYGAEFSLRRMAQEGLVTTPRLVLSGKFICMTGGHGWNTGLEADGPDEVRKAARSQLKLGADNIKLIATGGIMTPGTEIGAPQLSIEEMRAAVEEAHRAGKISAAHAHGATGVKNAIRAGVDSIEHGYLMDDECIELFLEHGTFLVATSTAVRNVVTYGTEAGIPADLVEKAKRAIDCHVDSFRKAYKAGVKLAMGTDSGVPYTRHGNNLDELVHLVEMGLSPMEAIEVSTMNSARLLRLDGMIGSLEAGKLADFLIVDGNPLEDIAVLRRPKAIESVVLGGKWVKKDGQILIETPAEGAF